MIVCLLLLLLFVCFTPGTRVKLNPFPVDIFTIIFLVVLTIDTTFVKVGPLTRSSGLSQSNLFYFRVVQGLWSGWARVMMAVSLPTPPLLSAVPGDGDWSVGPVGVPAWSQAGLPDGADPDMLAKYILFPSFWFSFLIFPC